MADSNRDEKGRILPGHAINPTGKGGFQDRPEDAAKGRWKISDTPGYWLKKFMTMSVDEFEAFANRPTSEITMAQADAINLHNTGIRDPDKSRSAMNALTEIMDRVEGKARQTIDTTIQNYVPPTINIVVSDDNPDDAVDAEK